MFEPPALEAAARRPGAIRTHRMSRPQETVATRTYLEMTSRAQLKPARLDDPDLTVRRVDPPAPEVWRHLYTEVGRQYRWSDRLPWTEDEARAYLDDPGISLWVLEVEARPQATSSFAARTTAPLRSSTSACSRCSWAAAWADICSPKRSSGPGPAARRACGSTRARSTIHYAIPNYLSRGFTIFRTEQYLAR